MTEIPTELLCISNVELYKELLRYTRWNNLLSQLGPHYYALHDQHPVIIAAK